MRYPSLIVVVVALGFLLRPVVAENESCDCLSGEHPIAVTGEIHFRGLPRAVVIAGPGNAADFAEEVYGDSFTASVNGLEAGNYTVEVDLAETEHNAPAQRSMDIMAGDVSLAHNLDLYRQSGGFAKAYKVEGRVDYRGEEAAGPLAIRFTGHASPAMFNAIRLKDAQGAVVASVSAAEVQAEAPPDADAVPDIKDPVIYTDPSQPIDQRVDDLIRRMSLREKVGQMVNGAAGIDRLNVPPYNYWNEALHGVARAGTATVFPQAIGMAAMWDPAELHKIADTISTEARGKYNDAVKTGPWSSQQWQYYGLTFWTPNINLFRDPRWGRGQETYGEDTFLTSRLAVAFITGLQGDDPNYIKALACAKHFAVHSGPESTRHTVDVEPSEIDFYDNYLPHFEAAVREGHVGAVMSAYNRVYGKSASGSPLLLTDILRGQWGFQGHVVSDCDSVGDIYKTHKIVETDEEAAALALKAGCDLNCGTTYRALANAVRDGLATAHDVDQALHRVLKSRFELGLFDPPEKVPFSKLTIADVDTKEHAALALAAAHESMVLLKNTGVLPLDRTKLKKIAVIGPNADSVPMLVANYNGTPSSPVTILQGIRAAGEAAKIEVTYLLDEVRDPDAHKSDLLGAGLLTVAVASLVAGIVEGSDWGWTSGRIIGAFGLATLTGAGVVVRSLRHPNPIIEPGVIRHRAVALADLSSLAFFGGFGAMVLGGVLLLTGVWHESVLRAGFMIAPGPLLAGLTAFPGGLLGARFGHRVVGTLGSLFFAAGGVWWITHVSAVPDWTGAYLPGSLLGGFGVGLMLPSLGGAATAPLPPQRFATGSALYAMTRQIGIALGVACLVAILGTAVGAPAVTAFHHAWIFMVGCSLLAGLLLQGIGSRVKETADASVSAEPLPPTPAPLGAPAVLYPIAAGK